MGWNNGLERKRFEARQKKQAEEYRKLGMTEEQIQVMYEFDLEQFRSNRRYFMHTQPIDTSDFKDETEEDESESTLLLKFSSNMTTKIEDIVGDDVNWWIEEINEQELYNKIQLLKPKQKELLTKMIVDELSLTEISRKSGIPYRTLKYRLQSIRKIFEKT